MVIIRTVLFESFKGVMQLLPILSYVQHYKKYHAARFEAASVQYGLNQLEIDILLFLHNNPGYDTARDICTYRQLKPALVSLYIENLVQLGFLAREGVPEDRRKCRLVLTEAAAPVVEKGLARQAAFTARMLEGLSPEELAAGQHCLSVITENIRNINEKGSV